MIFGSKKRVDSGRFSSCIFSSLPQCPRFLANSSFRLQKKTTRFQFQAGRFFSYISGFVRCLTILGGSITILGGSIFQLSPLVSYWMGGGWVELDLRFSPKRITLVSNHTDLSSTLLSLVPMNTLLSFQSLPQNPRVNPRVNPRLNPRVNPRLNPGKIQVKRRFQSQSVPFRSKIGVKIFYKAIF